MHSGEIVVLIGVVAGFGVLLAGYAGMRAVLLRPARIPAALPPITVLKPLKGMDDALEANLRSFFAQAYPGFQLVMGSPDADDLALDVARRVAAEYPGIDAVIAPGSLALGLNPKVNSLANLLQYAKHDVLLISDSNIHAPPQYLANLAAHLARPGVGLVTSIFRGVGAKGLGAMLDALHINTFVAGGIGAVNEFLRMPCVVGKSMMFRRGDLAALGGFEFLSRYLGEDQVCGEEIARLDKRVVVADIRIDNVLGHSRAAGFVARHRRWATIRRHITFGAYLGEIALNPFFVACIGVLALRTPVAAIMLGAVWLARCVLDRTCERLLDVRRPFAEYLWLTPLKDLLVAAVWFTPFINSTLYWRGDRVRVTRRSLLTLLENPKAAHRPEARDPAPSSAPPISVSIAPVQATHK